MFVNTQEFRREALYFAKHGKYDCGIKGSKYYDDYWEEQRIRSLSGYTVGGVWITGYHYFYLNFCQIQKVIKKNKTDTYGNRVAFFPDFWDLDYVYFMSLHIAKYGIAAHTPNKTYEEGLKWLKSLPYDLNLVINEDNLMGGKHLMFLKPRGIGASFKGGSVAARNFHLIEDSKTYMLADDKEYLIKDGLFTKFLDNRTFINGHTEFAKHSEYKTSITGMHFRASYTNERGDEDGYKSEVIGVSLKNNPDKARGKRGIIILWEEAGKFPNMHVAWQIARESVEEDGTAFGTMVSFGTGGCVCAGSVVWDNDGKLHYIENLPINNGILGFKDNKVSKEDITYWQKPTKKQCYKITTNTGRYLECSDDHPIYANKKGEFYYERINKERKRFKKVDFVETKDLKIGDYISVIDKVDIFGSKKMWQPRLIGWLIGDGTYGYNQTVRIANCEKEINDYLYNNFECKELKSSITKDGKIYKETRIKNIQPELTKLGINNQTKNNKRFPLDIHSYDKEDLKEFIGGLFDADGYISIRENKKRKSHIGLISLSSSSLNLINELRFLLQKFGIHGTIRTRKPRENNPLDKNEWYEFNISSSKSLVRFAEEIKLFPSEKQKRLNIIKLEFSKVDSHDNSKGINFEKIINIENIGIKDVYNLTANNSNTYIANGIITHNTEGADFEALEKMFFSPEAYNLLAFKNIFEEGMEDTSIGLFTPATMSVGIKDENGNSLQALAREQYDKRRAKAAKAPDGALLLQVKAENPYTPDEAVLNTTKNLFLTNELVMWGRKVKHDNNIAEMGVPKELYYDQAGGVGAKLSEYEPIRTYPHDPNKVDIINAPVVEWEKPFVGNNGKIPDGLYFICHDPFAEDYAEDTTSLGAAYVMMNLNGIVPGGGNKIVASYIARPKTVDEYNRNLFMLAERWNAMIAFESDRGDVLGYAKRKNKVHWLVPEMELAWDERMRTTRSNTVRYGIRMGSGKENIKILTGNRYLADWLIDERGTRLDNKTILNLHTIYDSGLLEELRLYRPNKNVDRISAIRVGMYYLRECAYKGVEVHKPQIRKSSSKKAFLERQLF